MKSCSESKVVLSNPVKTKAIASAKLKTDKVDALMLANLLRGGYIAECYVPSRRIMSLRELVRYRANLVRMRGNVKIRVHAYLLMNNIDRRLAVYEGLLGKAAQSQRHPGLPPNGAEYRRKNQRYYLLLTGFLG